MTCHRTLPHAFTQKPVKPSTRLVEDEDKPTPKMFTARRPPRPAYQEDEK